MTDAEQWFWYHVRDRRLEGFKFRRQVPLGDYIVDFLCQEARVVVELDGSQHLEQRERDEARTAWLAEHGYEVVRLLDNDVLTNIEGVYEELASALLRGRGRHRG